MRKFIIFVFPLCAYLFFCDFADSETTLSMIMQETMIVPDSVYSPDWGLGYRGLYCVDIINNYRSENGLDEFNSIEYRKNARLLNSEYSDEQNLIRFQDQHMRGGSLWQAIDSDSNNLELREIRMRENDRPNKYKSHYDYVLFRNGVDVYDFRAYSGYPIYQAYIIGEEWVICYQAGDVGEFHLVVNGTDLNETNNYYNCLAAAHFRGHLFYIFESDYGWGWSFNGVEGIEKYEQVVCKFHDGEGNAFGNPKSYGGFYALRDGIWYFAVGKVESKTK